VATSRFEAIEPKTKEDFKTLADMVVKKLSRYSVR